MAMAAVPQFVEGKAVLLAALAVLALGQTACSSHAYDEHAQRYVEATQAVLIARGHCASAADCSQRELLKFSAGGFEVGPIRGGGVEVNLYAQTDAQVWPDVEREFKSLHAKHPKVPVSLRSYSGPHATPGRVINELVLK
jgi:TctA family transporter